MKKILLLFALAFAIACSSSKGGNTPSPSNSEESTYGYTEKNPIKVGGFTLGPQNVRNYFNSITGPNGEAVSFRREGSCCQFKTANSPFGMGMLDIYSISYAGKNDTIQLYLNLYDKATLKAPKGFIMK